jgi:hypothetical protein
MNEFATAQFAAVMRAGRMTSARHAHWKICGCGMESSSPQVLALDEILSPAPRTLEIGFGNANISPHSQPHTRNATIWASKFIAPASPAHADRG